MIQLFGDEIGKQLQYILEESNQRLRLFAIGARDSSLQSWVLGKRLAEILFKSYACEVEWEREEIFGLWMLYVPQLDLWGTGDTKEEAVEDLIAAAEDYREVYLQCISFYLSAGREKHLPYVLRLALAGGDREKIKTFLGLHRE
ncbi:MAG: hypothetical protein ACOX6Z_06140 [Dethiobacteria bacterium]|jgi:hypothetical protein